MTPPKDPQAILEKVREHMERYEVVPTLSLTRIEHIHDVYNDFPTLAASIESLVAENKWWRDQNAELINKLEEENEELKKLIHEAPERIRAGMESKKGEAFRVSTLVLDYPPKKQ